MKLITALAALLLVGCGYNNSKTPMTLAPKNPTETNQTDGQPVKLDFAGIKSKIFEPRCLSCHSGSGGNAGGVNLETYASVKPIVNDILAAVKDNSMPKKSSPLSDSDKSLLEKWVQEGAVEVASDSDKKPAEHTCPTPTPPPTPTPCEEHMEMVAAGILVDVDNKYSANSLTMKLEKRNDDCHDDTRPPSKLDFSVIRSKIFEPKCFKCHSESAGNRADINLETYENVKPIVANILASVKDNSMPRRAPPLSDDDKALLEKWIIEGAIETAPDNNIN